MTRDGAAGGAVDQQPSPETVQPALPPSELASPLPRQPHVSVVIVNWNTRLLLRQCLQSILDEPGVDLVSSRDHETGRARAGATASQAQPRLLVEILVVDNASSDGSGAMVQEEFPQVQLMTNEHNVGFAAANNQAIQRARGPLLFLLNPDAFLRPGALNGLARFLADHPEAAAVAPNVLNPDGTWQATAFRFPKLWDLFCEAVFLSVLWPRSSVFGRRNLGGFNRDRVRVVDWVQGCAMVVRRSVWDAVGPFDEGYWMYAEELDWFRRAHGLDYRVFFCPDAEVVHYGKRAVARARARVLPIGFRSQFRYFRKFDGPGVELAVRVITFLQMGLRAAISAGMIVTTRDGERERWQENWQAYTAVLREALNLF